MYQMLHGSDLNHQSAAGHQLIDWCTRQCDIVAQVQESSPHVASLIPALISSSYWWLKGRHPYHAEDHSQCEGPSTFWCLPCLQWSASMLIMVKGCIWRHNDLTLAVLEMTWRLQCIWCPVVKLTMVKITVDMKVGDVLVLAVLVVLLDEGRQALIEEALHQLHIVSHLRKDSIQAESPLQPTCRLASLDLVLRGCMQSRWGCSGKASRAPAVQRQAIMQPSVAACVNGGAAQARPVLLLLCKDMLDKVHVHMLHIIFNLVNHWSRCISHNQPFAAQRSIW